MQPSVAVVNCTDYRPLQVRQSLEEALGLLGGIESIVKPGQQVLVKLNLVMPKSPEHAATTNPVILEWVVRILQAAGAKVILADSPGGPFNSKTLQRAYDKCGITAVAERTGAELNFNTSEATVPCPEGKIIKSLRVMEAVLKADVVISLPKLKTHGLTLLTGAVKNMFGAVPGLVKAEYHVKMPRIKDFAEILVDIALCVKPRLSILDAVVCMEGEGPTGGRPRPVGVILASADPFALDVVGSELVGVAPQQVPVIACAMDRGLTAGSSDKFQLLGLAKKEWPIVKDFKLPLATFKADKGLLGANLPDFLAAPLEKALRPKPVFIHELCVGCGDCVQNCPPQAVKLVDRRPEVDLARCIRCYCCQELCPAQAVQIKHTWLGRKLFG